MAQQLREYKSSVFTMLLEEPANCLQVYNALNDTSYEDANLVEIRRLDDGILLSIRNDASFLIDNHLNLYEHQSTYSPNMPLRSLIYFTKLIRERITNEDLFKRQRIIIPVPHFVVFYNGTEDRPEKETMFLSSSYAHAVDEPDLELKCTVYNINSGNNQLFLAKCPVLAEYMTLVDKIRSFKKAHSDIETAIDLAIRECIEEHVLEDFLIKRGNEVMQVVALDYTFERREKLFRAESEKRGDALRLIRQVCKKLAKHQSIEQIADDLVEEQSVIEEICTIAADYAPDYNEEAILEKYMCTLKS